jgi:hypothetical protein
MTKNFAGVGVKKQKKPGNDYKKRGEWVELKFLAEAAQRNLPTSKPYGDSENFDVVVGRPGKFVGVQVKSTASLSQTKVGYECKVRTGQQAYAAGAFDFLAAYIVPENVWYIVPAKLIHGKRSIMLCPNLPTAKYEQYREAWNLLQEAVGVKEEPTLPVEESAPANRMEARMMGAFNFVRKHWDR